MLGRLVGLTDTSGSAWTYTYDMLGNRLSGVTVPLASVWLTSRLATDPDLGTWTYIYDGDSDAQLQL